METSSGGESPADGNRGRRKDRVLWVGGDEEVAARVEDGLDGVRVRHVGTLEAAFDRLASEPVDAAVVDGGIDPAGSLCRLREREPRLPVVLVAAPGASVGGGTLDRNATLFVPGADPVPDLAETVVDVLAAGEGPHKPIRGVPPNEELGLKERAMDEAPIGITISDPSLPDNPLVYANQGFEAMTGYTVGEAVGDNCRFLQGPDTDPETVDRVREAVDAGEPATVEILNYRKNGEPFWNRLRIAPLYENGELVHFVGFQMDVTARKRAEIELRRGHERLEHLLGRLRGLVVDTTRLLTAADSTVEIHREVAARFGSDAEYSLAWVGEYDAATGRVEPVAVGGVDAPVDTASFDLSAADPASEALRQAVESAEPVVLEGGADRLSFVDVPDDASVAVVPFTYRDTVYGVLTVIGTGRETFEGPERDVLSALGRSIGSAVNAVGSKRLVTTDAVIEVTVSVERTDAFPFGLSGRADTELTYETGRLSPDGGFVGLFTAPVADVESVLAAAADDEEVAAVDTLAEVEEGAVLQFRLAEAPLVRLLSDHGAHLESMTATEGTGTVTFEAPDDSSARTLIERLKGTYPAELVAYQESWASGPTVKEFQSAVEERLTDRQLTALEQAYVSGFFDWPREVDGERLAESMGISPPTFHQHLRSAQKKVFTELFDP
jgi:hypothetical protein